ncbi:MAG: hypothetical protein HC853_04110 [Anaerolineae bacterium]|nr:hypothetical protein [Anaerolineae bacterium]
MKHAFYTLRNWLVLATLCATTAAFSGATHPAQAASPQAIAGCPTNYSIDVTMTLGTRWEMCWDRDAQRGLVLNQISFTPKNSSRILILGSAALAQLYVAYDDGGTKHSRMSDTGLTLANLNAADCPMAHCAKIALAEACCVKQYGRAVMPGAAADSCKGKASSSTPSAMPATTVTFSNGSLTMMARYNPCWA